MAACLLAAGCRTSKPQIVREARSGQWSHRNLMVFMDGTANTFESRTNVRRLFDLVTAQERPEILAYYMEGVGTDSFRIAGGMFGAGFSKRVRDAATWLAQNYKPGDSIYIFGFSRGAYEAMELSAFVGIAGLPKHEGDQAGLVRSWYAEFRRAAAEQKRERARLGTNSMAMEQRMRHIQTSASSKQAATVEVLGIWDSVEALGFLDFLPTAFGAGPSEERRRQIGHPSHYIDLGPHVRHCFYALALDERRQSFMPELPDHRAGQPGSYEFVWFAGDHSDVGGGHAMDKELAGFSFNWMLSRIHSVTPSGKPVLPPFQVHENTNGRRHDLSLDSRLMRPMRKRVRGEVFADPTIHKRDGTATVRPVRSAGWKMHLHESVLARMQLHKEAVGGRYTYLQNRTEGEHYVPWPFRDEGGWVQQTLTPNQITNRFEVTR